LKEKNISLLVADFVDIFAFPRFPSLRYYPTQKKPKMSESLHEKKIFAIRPLKNFSKKDLTLFSSFHPKN